MPTNVELKDGTFKDMYTVEELEAERKKAADEIEAKRQEDEKHYKTKIDEFAQGLKGAETKREAAEKEALAKIEEAKKIAEEATARVTQSESSRLKTYEDHVIEQYVGSDPELKKKIEEAAKLVNIPRDSETNVAEIIKTAVRIAGLENSARGGSRGVPTYGGFAPVVGPSDKTQSEAEYNKFVDALAMGDFLKGKEKPAE